MAIRANNDNFQVAVGRRYRASAGVLFAPAAVIATSCTLLLFFLEITGQGEAAAAHLAMAILAFGLPVLLVHALARLLTTGIQPMTHGLFLNRGFPYRKGILVPWQSIEGISAGKGIAGHFFDCGTLVCKTDDGRAFVIRDLEGAETARSEIQSIIERYAAGRQGSAGRGNRPPPAVTG